MTAGLTTRTADKAWRLYNTGQTRTPRHALLITVHGDTGTHDVTLGDDGTMYCTCPARTLCAHVGAALLARDNQDTQ